MVEILHDEINKSKYQGYQFDENEVSDILKVLEDAGMKPPSYLQEYNPLPSKTAHVLIREWEPEDE